MYLQFLINSVCVPFCSALFIFLFSDCILKSLINLRHTKNAGRALRLAALYSGFDSSNDTDRTTDNNMTTPEQQALQALQQQMTQQQQQMSQQQQIMTQQQQQIELLTSHLRTETENKTNTSQAHHNPKIVPTKPDTYNGQRRTPADVWLFNLEQYFRAVAPPGGLTDEFKMNFAASQLRDSATTWWRRQTQRTYTSNNTGAGSGLSLTSCYPNAPSSWKEFKDAFLKQFLPIATKDSARADLHNIKQRGSVAGYCDAFNTILIRLDQEDMSEDDQLFLFKKGLNRDMQQYLLLVRPKTLAEAQALAVRFEAENPYRNTNNYNAQRNSQPTYSRQPLSQSSSSSGSTPMELGRIQQQEQESTNEEEDTEEEQTYQQLNAMNKKLTPEEVEEHKRQGKCFRCGKHGHISRNCPTRNNQNTKPQAQGKK